MSDFMYTPSIVKPKGAGYFIKGAWHKVGLNDAIFIHIGTQWIRSVKTFDQYSREVTRLEQELLQ